MSSATNTTDESLPAPVTPAPSRGKPDRPAVSARRSAASRANGARSRDPKSPEGKRRSSRNATRHGLTATKILVVEGESSADYRRFEDEWLAELRPSGPIETALAEEIIHTPWRQRRLWRMEATSLDIEMDQAAELRDILGRKPPEPARRLAMAFQAFSNGGVMLVLNRYEARLSRTFDRKLKLLRELQAARPPLAPAGVRELASGAVRPVEERLGRDAGLSTERRAER